jgi:hypothetical protein
MRPRQLPSAMTGCGSSWLRSSTITAWKCAVRRISGMSLMTASNLAMLADASPCTPA